VLWFELAPGTDPAELEPFLAVIASIVGASTWAPGHDEWWGFVLMLRLIVVGAVTTYAVLDRRA
jgi:hypothetical protein